MKEINPTKDEIFRKADDKPEKRLNTFDDLAKSSDSHKQLNTFDDIARQGESKDSIRTFDDIAGHDKHFDHKFTEDQRLDEAGEKLRQNDGLKSEKEKSELREKKSEIIEGMVTKDFPISSEKRLDNARDFHYLDKKEFAEELKHRDTSITERDIEPTEGFYDVRDKQAFVKDTGDTLEKSIHEKLHQKSISELPTRLNEGITEYFTREEAGAWGELKNIDAHGRELPKIPTDYEKEVEIVRKLDATIGKEPLHAAYFEGKTEVLKNHVDNILGNGAFDKINNALEVKDYKTASEIIERYYKKIP